VIGLEVSLEQVEIQLVEAWVEQWALEVVGLSVVGSIRRSAAATTESEPETEPVAVRLGELVGVSEGLLR
jgi:hypothetical protein